MGRWELSRKNVTQKQLSYFLRNTCVGLATTTQDTPYDGLQLPRMFWVGRCRGFDAGGERGDLSKAEVTPWKVSRHGQNPHAHQEGKV